MAVRVGFIGCGGMANGHFRTLSQMENVERVAFCDVNAERAQKSVDEYGGKAYSNYRQMLDEAKPDAVYIVVPPGYHDDIEVEVANRKIPFFIEKPVALSNEATARVLDVVRTNDLTTAVGYHWRYQGGTDRAQELLEGKTIGMALGYWMGGLPGVAWWRRMEGSGGQFVEQTTHIVDLARYLVGDVKRVYAAAALRDMHDIENINVPDVGTATLEFENGAVGTINNTCMLGVGGPVSLHIVARDLWLEVGGKVKVRDASGERVEGEEINPTLREDQAFIKAVETGDRSEIRSDYADGAKTLAVTLAINESFQTRQPVDL
jgi:myo-inositol 2-dehydrogenase / D-chiro-inositol 1-dehydrogenase